MSRPTPVQTRSLRAWADAEAARRATAMTLAWRLRDGLEHSQELAAFVRADDATERARELWAAGTEPTVLPPLARVRRPDLCGCGKPAEHVTADEESADWPCLVPLPAFAGGAA
jgi:hypothetical protein